ncbi:hypothetical protein OSTOST_18322, partial [Ostertagia ostertagi]
MEILSGVDAPLKTNLELIKDSPLPLVKSSLAATFSREAANFMSKNEVVQEQFRFLKGTYCADESLWGTIAGNPELLPMPGGFDGKDFLLRKYGGVIASWRRADPWTAPPMTSPPSSLRNATSKMVVDSYAISRYQQWMIETNSLCRGRYYRLSCVYGVDDLPVLIRRSELESRRRSLQPVSFSAAPYTNLPDAP